MNEELFKALVWKKAQNNLTNEQIGEQAGLGKETVRRALLVRNDPQVSTPKPHPLTVKKLEAWLNAQEAEEPDSWIPVEERLPEAQGHFLVHCPRSYPKNYKGRIAEYYEDVQKFYAEDDGEPILDATHYQPLPQAPKQ